MLFGSGDSPIFKSLFWGNMRLGNHMNKPSSTGVAATLVGWKMLCPDFPLSHQLPLQCAQTSWDEEVVPATDVGVGARLPLHLSVQVAPSQLQGGGAGEDTFMVTVVHQLISIVWNTLEETPEQVLWDMVQFTIWHPSIKISAALWCW